MKTGEELVRGHTFFGSEEWLDIVRKEVEYAPRSGAVVLDGTRLPQAIDELALMMRITEVKNAMHLVAQEGLSRDQVLEALVKRLDALEGRPRVASEPANPLVVRPPK